MNELSNELGANDSTFLLDPLQAQTSESSQATQTQTDQASDEPQDMAGLLKNMIKKLKQNESSQKQLTQQSIKQNEQISETMNNWSKQINS